MRNPPYFLNRNYSGRFASTKVLPTFPRAMLIMGIATASQVCSIAGRDVGFILSTCKNIEHMKGNLKDKVNALQERVESLECDVNDMFVYAESMFNRANEAEKTAHALYNALVQYGNLLNNTIKEYQTTGIRR